MVRLGIALWFGLIIGLVELVLTRVQKPLTDPSPGLFRMNRHIMWTIPAVNLVVFGSCGLVMALVLRARPRLGVRAVVSPLVFLATLTLLLSCRWLHVLACLVVAFLFAYRLPRRVEASPLAFRRLVRRTMPALAGLVAVVIGLSLGGQVAACAGRPLLRPRDQRLLRTLQARTSFWSCSTRCERTI